MKLTSFLRMMVFITAVALAYTHLQMKIFDLAYEGKKKENHIHQLIEQNGNLTYQILTLESANHLGYELLNKDSDMQFGSPDSITKMRSAQESFHEDQGRMPSAVKGKESPLVSLLSSRIKPAE